MDTSTSPPASGAILRVEPLGDRALLVVFGESIDAQVNGQVHRLAAVLADRGLAGIQDLVPAYATLAVHYNPSTWASPGQQPHEAVEAKIRRLWAEARAGSHPPSRFVEIPVCYGGEYGPDLGEVARRCRLSEEAVIARHTTADYRVFMLGFTPGFAYLGGLDPALAVPRRDTPRLKVPAGSVGIAGAQTGIYPMETPGGWQVVGRTPRKLFDPCRKEPCLLKPADRVRFVRINGAIFQADAEGAP